jgi:hypothetical protein
MSKEASRKKSIFDSPTIKKYIESSKAIFRSANGREMTSDEELILKKEIKKYYKPKEILWRNSYRKTSKEANLLSVIDFIEDTNPIVTGNGTLFKREDLGGKNITGSFVGFILKTRKEFKELMFIAQDAKNEEEEDFYDMRQKVFKVLANAYYGSIGMKAFIFHDEYCAPAVTASGESIITSLIQKFEQFLGDNWDFESWGDIFDFIDKSLIKEPIYECDFIETEITDKIIIKRLVGKLKSYGKSANDDKFFMEKLKSSIRRLDTEQKTRLFFRNNLFAFLNEEVCLDLIADALSFTISSGNKDDIKDENLLEILNALYDLLNDFVIMPTCYERRTEFCMEKTKTTILLTDTDSTFANVSSFSRHVSSNFDIDLKVKERRITVCNIAIFLLGEISKRILYDWATSANLEEDKKEILNLKNEFLYSRIMLTKNKKNYAGVIISKEGKLLDPPKDDIKGLDIKKVKTNISTRNYFQKILKDDILSCDVIDPKAVIEKFIEYEKLVRDSLERFETNFLTPSKFGNPDSYVNAYKMMQVRCSLIWNELNPENTILPAEYIDVAKTKANTEEDFDRIVKENLDYFSDEDLETLEKVKNYVFHGHEEMKHFGFTSFAVRKTEEKYPSWLKPFLDTDTIVQDNINAAIILLESIGFKILKVKDKSRYSTYIEI